jgi:hypothetical protein
MNLFIVECEREYEADAPRLGVVIASAIEEAEDACRRAYSPDGYAHFKPVSLWKANFLALLGKLALRGRNSLGDRELLNLLARAAGHLFISLAQNHRSQMCGRQGACQSADIISVHSLDLPVCI